MYYAYSISLMYFLRAKNNQEITDDIFNKLKLNEEQKAQLNRLLSKDPQQEFTKEEIETIIEPILAQATRVLAAEQTKTEFKRNPQASSLFTAALYGVEYYFKKSSLVTQPELSELIDHEFTDKDYTEAEIYRVANLEDSMLSFTEIIVPEVNENFEQQWESKAKALMKEKGQLTEEDIKFHKAIILNNILREKTIEFFLAYDDELLNEYINHLKEDRVWGTEETLMILHRAIQGERLERNQHGTIDTFYDTQICLHIHKNNRSPFRQAGIPEMILNNLGNTHWTSKIPETIFVPTVKSEKHTHSASIDMPATSGLDERKKPDTDNFDPSSLLGSDLLRELDDFTPDLGFQEKQKPSQNPDPDEDIEQIQNLLGQGLFRTIHSKPSEPNEELDDIIGLTQQP